MPPRDALAYADEIKLCLAWQGLPKVESSPLPELMKRVFNGQAQNTKNAQAARIETLARIVPILGHAAVNAYFSHTVAFAFHEALGRYRPRKSKPSIMDAANIGATELAEWRKEAGKIAEHTLTILEYAPNEATEHASHLKTTHADLKTRYDKSHTLSKMAFRKSDLDRGENALLDFMLNAALFSDHTLQSYLTYVERDLAVIGSINKRSFDEAILAKLLEHTNQQLQTVIGIEVLCDSVHSAAIMLAAKLGRAAETQKTLALTTCETPRTAHMKYVI